MKIAPIIEAANGRRRCREPGPNWLFAESVCAMRPDRRAEGSGERKTPMPRRRGKRVVDIVQESRQLLYFVHPWTSLRRRA
jgi:hypothetical protein